MSRLEELLGRQLRDEERGTIPTLNDLGPQMLAEAKALAAHSWPIAVRYLQFYVARSTEAADFCEEVLVKGADPASWGTRDVICVRHAHGAGLLSFRVDEAIESLKAIEGERWFRIPVAGPATHFRTAGAPGVLIRGTRYWWSKPEGTDAFFLDQPVEIVRDADLTVAFRRWLASRISWSAEALVMQGAATIVGIVAALDGSDVQLSEDARLAIGGLLRELKTPDGGQAPPLGFRGPDEWYRSP